MNNYNLYMLVFSTAIIGILLNLIIPHIFINIANDEEKDVSNEDIGLKGNIMRMLVYNSHYPLTSSIVIAVAVGLSVYLGSFIKIRPAKLQSLNKNYY